jgi:hypothetical protein
VGTGVGSWEGKVVGCGVGSVVGESVLRTDGAGVGCTEGTTLGAKVGVPGMYARVPPLIDTMPLHADLSKQPIWRVKMPHVAVVLGTM